MNKHIVRLLAVALLLPLLATAGGCGATTAEAYDVLGSSSAPGAAPSTSVTNEDPAGAASAAPLSATTSTPVPSGALPSAAALPASLLDASDGILLGVPTDASVPLTILPDKSGSIRFTWLANGATPAGSSVSGSTGIFPIREGESLTTELTGLAPDTAYTYTAFLREEKSDTFVSIGSGAFHTSRMPAEDFVFTVQADSHRDENSSPDVYGATLASVLADRPDFHVDLGDTFMAEKLAQTQSEVRTRYLDDRAFFARLAGSVPLLLVNGNHEGENGWDFAAGTDNIASWASTLRTTLFPSSTDTEFFSGSTTQGGNHVAFTWGDALFVTLDPYANTMQKRRSDEDGWNCTLGGAQYDWLVSTLRGSDAKWKFVFVHNLVGGIGKDSRGGSEAADWFEWGGQNADGTDGFAENRPGWEKPIHDLLVETGVTAVFHGHDHFYARQEKDGVIYQLVPQPSHPGSTVMNGSEYGYESGQMLPPSGHLRVLVSSAGVRIDYVKTLLANAAGGATTASTPGTALADSYRVGTDGSILQLPIDATSTTGTTGGKAGKASPASSPSPSSGKKGGAQNGGSTGQPGTKGGGQKGGSTGGQKSGSVLPTGLSSPTGFISPPMLGRPTATSVAVSIHPASAMEWYVEYGTTAGTYGARTGTARASGGLPVEQTVTGLPSGRDIHLRVRWRTDTGVFQTGTDLSFSTAPPSGSTFTFTVQGDSHPERAQQFDADWYLQAMRNVAAGNPDFHILLGDDFSVDTMRAPTQPFVAALYAYQRQFLAQIGRPVFLVNGNHEQAARYVLDGTSDNVAVWGQNARNLFLPQPAPDGFYTGDTEQVPHIGLLRDYAAFTWGDALFVTIDPYWHSDTAVDNQLGSRDKGTDPWAATLGDAQYAWLEKTLESSRAKYKFVFAHHVLGTGRGGIEEATRFEWGGRNQDGSWGFDTARPDWEKPIQQLMADNDVTIFFQGHDHVYAKQALDGVVYQTAPSPADPNEALLNADAFRSGLVLPGSGHLRVTVSPAGVKVDYVKTSLGADNGRIITGYSIP